MKYSKTIIKHFTLAMKTEISRLTKVYERVGDDWPPWFDVNDIPLFAGMVKWLENLETDTPEDEYINSKPYWFMMECVSRYANENIESLSDHELSEIVQFWDEYAKRNRSEK